MIKTKQELAALKQAGTGSNATSELKTTFEEILIKV